MAKEQQAAPSNRPSGPEAPDPAWLHELVVIDVGDEATIWAGGLLAELGARVLRVEVEGDAIRSDSLLHATANAGKHSWVIQGTVTPDGRLGSDDDATALERLLSRAPAFDVAIGPMDPRHPGATIVDRLAERGVPTVRTVFRRGHPGEAATDLIVEAAGGQLVLNGGPDDPPAHPAGDLGFKQTSLAVAEAALALALSRRRSGQVGHVEVSAQEAMAMTTIQTANGNYWHWHRKVPGRHPKLTEGSTVRSADGKWTSFTIHGPNWLRFVEWVGEVLGPQGIEGPEWNDSEHAVANRHVVSALIARMAAALPQQVLLEQGQARGLLLLPVQDLGQVAGDQHLVERNFYERVGAPVSQVASDTEPAVVIPGSPFRSDHGRSRRGPAPDPGEGGAALLDSLVDRSVPTGSDAIDPRQPLSGVRIVDFCWAIAGPLTTRLLAGLGAEVIKIESENGLDTIRYIGVQPPGSAGWDTNGVFQDTSPNKKAVTINVDTAEGRAVVEQLIATADVVTANYTPDRMDRWGLGADRLARLKPDIITVNMSVMGTFGPNAAWRSYGSGIVAMCGLAAHTGQPDRLPECLGTLHTDFTVPYFAALHIMAALHQRTRSGRGAHLELAQYETAVRLLDVELARVLQGAPVPPRRGNRSPRYSPHGVFESAGTDRWLAVACRDGVDWEAMVGVIPDLRGLDRISQSDEVEVVISRWSAGLAGREASRLLQDAGVPASPVEDLSDFFGWDTAMGGAWSEIELVTGQSAIVLNEPLLWNGRRLPLRRAPAWFEHTYEVVCGELGLEPEVFAQLVDEQILW